MTTVQPADCHWPTVAEPYATALHELVAYALANYAPVGIIAAGSILRGEAGPSSDWDVYLIHSAPERQRVQRVFNGVPAEIFINPLAAVRRYFEEEHAALRPCTAHMLSHGFVVAKTHPVVDELLAEARAWLAKPFAVSEEALTFRRYMAVDLLDNARDILGEDDVNARRLLNQAVDQLLDYVFWSARHALPRQKRYLAVLAELDPTAAALARRYYAGSDIDQAVALAEQLAQHTVGATGFFAWSSTPERVANN